MFKRDKENRVVRIKLPEKFLTDDNGAPVVLTPNILKQIQNSNKKETKKKKYLMIKKKHYQQIH